MQSAGVGTQQYTYVPASTFLLKQDTLHIAIANTHQFESSATVGTHLACVLPYTPCASPTPPSS